jgi:hypothetical protein
MEFLILVLMIRINAKDIISNDESKSKLWWGPFPFVFDNVTFYQLVYKKTDIDAPWNEVRMIFDRKIHTIDIFLFFLGIHYENFTSFQYFLPKINSFDELNCQNCEIC